MTTTGDGGCWNRRRSGCVRTPRHDKSLWKRSTSVEGPERCPLHYPPLAQLLSSPNWTPGQTPPLRKTRKFLSLSQLWEFAGQLSFRPIEDDTLLLNRSFPKCFHTHMVIRIDSFKDELSGSDCVVKFDILAEVRCHRLRLVDHYYQVFRIRSSETIPRPTNMQYNETNRSFFT